MAKPLNSAGSSTPMPSVKLELGNYVTVRPAWTKPPKADGTRRVFFQVPERLRPSDWPSLIPLPTHGPRRGNLADGEEVGRIQRDAARLLEDLKAARTGATAARERRDMPALVRSWKQTQRFKDKKPKTQKGYEWHAGIVEAWAASLGGGTVASIKSSEIEEFLAHYDDRKTTRRHILVVLKMLLEHAIDCQWLEKSPAARINAKAPKTKVTIWEQADVDFYAYGAVQAGQPALAAMILTQWQIGQRLTDCRMFRRGKAGSGAEYQDSVFRFWQSKTNQYVTIPVSPALNVLLDQIKVDDSPYLFVDRTTGAPWDENPLSKAFVHLRKACPKGRPLVLRALRHSCVVQLARAGCTVPEIASITGHSILSVERILSTYLPRDNEVAWSAQAKRGLVAKKESVA